MNVDPPETIRRRRTRRSIRASSVLWSQRSRSPHVLLLTTSRQPPVPWNQPLFRTDHRRHRPPLAPTASHRPPSPRRTSHPQQRPFASLSNPRTTFPFTAPIHWTVVDGWMVYTGAGGVMVEAISNIYADGCQSGLLDPPVRPTVDDLVAAWATSTSSPPQRSTSPLTATPESRSSSPSPTTSGTSARRRRALAGCSPSTTYPALRTLQQLGAGPQPTPPVLGPRHRRTRSP